MLCICIYRISLGYHLWYISSVAQQKHVQFDVVFFLSVHTTEWNLFANYYLWQSKKNKIFIKMNLFRFIKSQKALNVWCLHNIILVYCVINVLSAVFT